MSREELIRKYGIIPLPFHSIQVGSVKYKRATLVDGNTISKVIHYGDDIKDAMITKFDAVLPETEEKYPYNLLWNDEIIE